MTSPAGDAGELGAQLLAWARHPEIWLLAAVILGSVCSSITAARLAHHTGRSAVVWAALGLVPVLGQLWVAFLAGTPGREVVHRLDRIEDFLIRGIPPERLQALLVPRPAAEPRPALAGGVAQPHTESRPPAAAPPGAAIESEGS